MFESLAFFINCCVSAAFTEESPKKKVKKKKMAGGMEGNGTQLFLNSLFFFKYSPLREKKNIYIYKKGSLFYFSYGWWSCSAHCGVRPLAASLTWKLPARSEKRNIAPLIFIFFFFSLSSFLVN